MFLSIIIPAYNVQAYLEKCVLSCLNQDIDDSLYEIVIVNDGSEDDTRKIAELLANKYSNIHLINQENKGLSCARNVGLKNAQGEYVWFIDSDDYIEPCILGHISAVLREYNTDALWLQWRQVDESLNVCPKEKKWINKDCKKVMSGKHFLIEVLGMCFYAWSFIFKRDFLLLNDLSFKEGIYYEDIEAIPFFLIKAESVKYEPLLSYNYLQRKGSILHSFNLKVVDDLMYVYTKYSKLEIDSIELKKRFDNIRLFVARLCLNVVSSSSDKADLKNVIDLINVHSCRSLYACNSIKKSLINFIWRINERYVVYLYRIIYIKKKIWD